MSTQEDKDKHSRRFLDAETHIVKRAKLLKAKSIVHTGDTMDKQPHRLNKCSGMTCGNPDCVMCGNPRKIFKEKTIQEKSIEQDRLWNE